jgi:hypothetical protein
MALDTIPSLINGKTLTQHLLVLQECLATKGTGYLNKILGGVRCSNLELSKLELIFHLLSQSDTETGRGLECIFTLEEGAGLKYAEATRTLYIYDEGNPTSDYTAPEPTEVYNGFPVYYFYSNPNDPVTEPAYVIFYDLTQKGWVLHKYNSDPYSNDIQQDIDDKIIDLVSQPEEGVGPFALSSDPANGAPTETGGWSINGNDGKTYTTVCDNCSSPTTSTTHLETFITFATQFCKDCIVTSDPAPVVPPATTYYLMSESGVELTLENGGHINLQ